MAEDALKDNLRKLSEIETDIEELTRMEKLFDRLASVEATLHRLEESVRGFARTSEVSELRRDLKLLAEGRTNLERNLQLLEQRMMDQVSRLASADAAMLRDLEGFRRFFEKLQSLETSVDKLAASGLVSEGRLEELRDEMAQSVEEARKKVEARLGDQEADLRKLGDALEQRVSREELGSAASELRALQIRVDSIERGLKAQSETTQGSLVRLSEVDTKVIDDLGRVQRALERMGDVERVARRAAEAAQERVLPSRLDEVREELLEKLQEVGRVGERATALEAGLRRLQDAVAGCLRREDLEPLRQMVKDLQALNVPVAMEKRDAQLQALRQDTERLSKMDGEIIRELGRLAKAYTKVADIERDLARLREGPGGPGPARAGTPAPPAPPPPEPARAPLPPAPPATPSVSPESLRIEREGALQAIALLRKEFSEGAITRPSYREALRSTLAHLQEIRKGLAAAGAAVADEEEGRIQAELESLKE